MSTSKLYTSPRKASECNPNLWVLAPTTRATEEALRARGRDVVLRTDIKKGRNSKHNALYWARLHWLCRNNERIENRWPTKEDFSTELKKAILGVEVQIENTIIQKPDGSITTKRIEREIAKHINFETMPQEEYNEYFDLVFELIDRMIGPINWKEVDFEQKRIA